MPSRLNLRLNLRTLRVLLVSLLLPLFLLGGCATTNPRDPLEPINRAIYSFNDGVDSVVIRPIAEGYRAIFPGFVRTGVSNIFANVNDVLIALNNLLQGKVVNAISDVGRVLVNTTVGVVGFFDVATQFGLEKHNEDFGQTLGWWGVGDGPYLMLPIVGPSNLRDAVARAVDYRTDPLTYVRSMSLRNSLWGVRALSQRTDLLDTSKILETAALDPYEFLRDAYLQRRRSLVYDGAPPREKDDGAGINTPPRTTQTPDATPARVAAEAPSPVVTEATTQARAVAPDEAAVTSDAQEATAAPAAEPQADVVLPSESTAAGAPEQNAQQTMHKVLKVWVSDGD